MRTVKIKSSLLNAGAHDPPRLLHAVFPVAALLRRTRRWVVSMDDLHENRETAGSKLPLLPFPALAKAE